MKINILSTAPLGQISSMNHYLNILDKVHDSECFSNNSVHIKHLSLSNSFLEKTPNSLKNYFHHFFVILNTLFLRFQNSNTTNLIVDGSHSYLVNFLKRKNINIVFAHDLIPLLNEIGTLKADKPSFFGRQILKLNKMGLIKANKIIAISNSTKNDLINLLKIQESKIHVLHNPISANGTAEGIKQNYIFHIGHNGHYKNRESVLKVFSELLEFFPDLKLKMAGPPPSLELKELSSKFKLVNKIDWLEFPSDEEVINLYKNAKLLLFPSRYEGFGWPPLEAQALGTPVVCSNVASLPEVVEDSALTSAPEDIETFVEHCRKILSDSKFSQEMVDRGYENTKRFSLDQYTKKLKEIYEYNY
ncbi:MAG: glycosyltransferase family 4 protein [Lentisphaeria bacterium]|nr:glycosyltransferase family 4 protein [Lentisphaeria bacterium]